MPNWNQNYLTVYGSEKEIKAFKQKVKSKDSVFDFEKICPTPKELKKTQSPNNNKFLAQKLMKKYGSEDWYHWRLAHWGTKWNIDGSDINWDDNRLAFETAWMPPIGIMAELSNLFPNLIFSLQYYEPGMNFSGFMILNNQINFDEHTDSDEYDFYNEKKSETIERKIDQYITGIKLIKNCKTSYNAPEILAYLKKTRDERIKRKIVAVIMKHISSEQLCELTKVYPQLIEFVVTK